MNAKYEHLGKEVLLNGQHFADAVSLDAAKLIAGALNLCNQLGKAKRT